MKTEEAVPHQKRPQAVNAVLKLQVVVMGDLLQLEEVVPQGGMEAHVDADKQDLNKVKSVF
jgi:hypothetical protein